MIDLPEMTPKQMGASQIIHKCSSVLIFHYSLLRSCFRFVLERLWDVKNSPTAQTSSNLSLMRCYFTSRCFLFFSFLYRYGMGLGRLFMFCCKLIMKAINSTFLRLGVINCQIHAFEGSKFLRKDVCAFKRNLTKTMPAEGHHYIILSSVISSST